jgi:sugar phosphate isomerase/epimerase
VFTSRRDFVKAVTVSGAMLRYSATHAFARETRLHNPIFAYEFGDISPAQQAGAAHDAGFAGTVFDHSVNMAERLRALDLAQLQLFFLWITVDVAGGGTKYEPGMEAAIASLQGRGTVVWVAIQGGGDGAEDRAIAAVRHIADLASQANLRVALYPHYQFYLARFRDVVRFAEATERSNVGVTFNLCHELRSGWDTDFTRLMQRAIPQLYGVTINGADRQGQDWDKLIQPLGRGDYDVAALVQTFVTAGYRGPFGIQCYGLKGDPAVYLKQSMTAWRTISG